MRTDFKPVVQVEGVYRVEAIEHARKEYADMFAHFQSGPASIRAMKELVAVCRANGIRVAFLDPSVSPTFRDSFAAGVHEAGEASLRQLAEELDVTVFPPLPDVTDGEFMDGHHMMKHGAERYSRWLADTHLKPWLATHGRSPP